MAAAALAVAAGSASAAGSDPMTAVPQGVNPLAMPGATVFGSTPAATAENVSFVLNMNNKNRLEQEVTGGMSNFLSVKQFASTYGQSQQSINALVSYLGHFGITSTVLSNHLIVDTNGTAGAYDAALNVTQEQVSVPAFRGHGDHTGVPAQTVHAPTGAAFLPRSIAKSVLSILGLANYSSDVSNAVRAVDLPTSNLNADPISQAQCAAATGLPLACQTPMDFASRYGLSGLYNRGALGQGETIGIVTLAALEPTAPGIFWQNILGMQPSGRTVNVVNVDGGPGAPSLAAGSDETDLDTEQSGALAPDANVIVYQAPNTDPGFIDAFAQAASDNIADTVSASWGEAEAAVDAFVAAGQESSAYEASFDEVFLELAAQGQSTFTSSGDEAAYTDADEIGSTELNVDTPADSPYITAAGGTSLPFTGTLGPDPATGLSTTISSGNAERAWGWDYLWQPLATIKNTPLATIATDPDFTAGDGGGFSNVEPQPSYQRGVPGTNLFSDVEYLTPTNVQNIIGNLNEPTAWNFNPNPRTTLGFGSGRAVPDVSTDADPESGYLLESPLAGGLGGGAGGTSFVAPQLNGSTAVIDSLVGHRVGFWNPLIYALATRFGSPFTPLNTPGTSNDNLFYTGTRGTVYNPATGLGVPNLAALGQDFANAGRGRGGF